MSHGVFEYFSVFAFSSAPQVSFFWGDGMCYSPPFTLISVKVMGSLFLIVWFVNYVAVKAPGLALGGATCKLCLMVQDWRTLCLKELCLKKLYFFV